MFVTVGCDPELIMFDKESKDFVSASRYFASNSCMGLDGHDYTAEVRPPHSKSPLEVVTAIREIIKITHEKFPNLQMYSGNYVNGEPIGGHVHVGFRNKRNINSQLLLDNIKRTVLPLIARFEDREQRELRLNSYGGNDDIREQDWGWEYRAPGSWLIHPSVAYMFLTATQYSAEATEMEVILPENFYETHLSRFLNMMRRRHRFISSREAEFGIGFCQKMIQSKIQFDWNKDIIPNWL